MKNVLIISNNCLSTTNNNGKTLLSFIDGLRGIRVYQLFFSGEYPRVEGYDYFRISDKDIIKGVLNTKRRGAVIHSQKSGELTDDFSLRRKVGRNKYTLVLRELLWHNRWKSTQLFNWLDLIRPDVIIFLAGDALFAYDICNVISERYCSRLTTYVTDDYVVPRTVDSWIERIRRNKIRNSLCGILKKTACFYTISPAMQRAYKEMFERDSLLALNMVEDLKIINNHNNERKEIKLIYAGSFYYGRSDVIKLLSSAIFEYNKTKTSNRAKLYLYSNSEPDDNTRNKICMLGASEYVGSLNQEQLKNELNNSDVLVFVESFDPEQIEKVKYSLSTKIPEYMSIGKPILAIGPKGVGSMDYLSDIAICITDPAGIKKGVFNLLCDKEMQISFGKKARDKYLTRHDKRLLQESFYHNVIG